MVEFWEWKVLVTGPQGDVLAEYLSTSGKSHADAVRVTCPKCHMDTMFQFSQGTPKGSYYRYGQHDCEEGKATVRVSGRRLSADNPDDVAAMAMEALS